MVFNNTIPFNRQSFQTIIRFYLFECPVRTYKKIKNKANGNVTKDRHPKYHYVYYRVSHRGFTFYERGLNKNNLNTLRNAMKRAAPGIILSAVDNIPIPPKADEYIVIKRNEDHVRITEGFFYCLRNGFAHGSFNVDGKYYLIENHGEDNTLKGIARLKESTLLSWIRLCSMSPDELKVFGKS